MPDTKHASLEDRLVIIGFGSIGQGVLPLILRHIDIAPQQYHDRHRRAARQGGRGAIRREIRRDAAHPRELPRGARAADRPRRFSAQCLGRGGERRADRTVPGKGRALSRHLHRAVAGRLYRPEPTASQRSNYALRESALALRRDMPRPDRGADPRRQSRPGLAFRQAGAASISPRTPASAAACPTTAPAGASSPSGSGSRSSISPSATPRSPRSRNRRASSSTPGRSTASSAKARSRPNSAGARMSGTSRPTAAGTISAAARRSICNGRAPGCACAAGRRSRAPIRVSSSPTTN